MSGRTRAPCSPSPPQCDAACCTHTHTHRCQQRSVSLQIQSENQDYPPAPGSGFSGGCAGCPGAMWPLSSPAVRRRPGAERAVCCLSAADLQTTDEHTRVSSAHWLAEGASRRAVARRLRGGGAVETLSLPELLSSAGEGRGGRGEGEGRRRWSEAGRRIQAGESGTAGSDIHTV